MTKQIFINLAVTDLNKSMDFYTALGLQIIHNFLTIMESVWFGVKIFL